MKTSNLSRITLLCGLALGIMVLWAAAAPSATGEDSLIGGDWYPETEGYCCSHDVPDQCKNYSGCEDWDTTEIIVCVPNDNGTGIAWGNGETPCDYGDPSCTECEECDCEGGNP